jgi:4-amino-4-deoxy-L-arabinose transferase-like glycosyltransferase
VAILESVSTVATINESAAPSLTELAPLRAPWQRKALYATLVLVLIFFAVVRVRLRNVPLERDEGEYAYSGQLILQGIPPYKLAYNMKLPGTYAAYAVIMGVLGETPAGIRLGLLLVNAATSILVFLLAKRLHGLLTGVIAGCTYALLSTRSSVLGFSGHATHFVIFFALLGILLLLPAIEKRKNSLIFLSGLFLGLGFLMKQHGILLAMFAGLYLLWAQRRTSIRNLLFSAALISFGVALPYVLTCVILYRAGVFHEFWFWTVSYGRAYASEMTVRDGLKMIRAVGPWMVRPFLIWGIAALGLTALIWNKKVRAQAAVSGGFLIFSVLAVIP